MEAVDATLGNLVDGVMDATTEALEEIVSTEIRMVRGDTRPVVEFTVKDKNGTVIAITGATPTFRIRRRGQTAVLVNRVCTISDGPGGKCRFTPATADWNAGAIDAPGHYDGELEVTFADASIETVFDLYDVVVRNAVG